MASSRSTARCEDDARLVVSIARTAAAHGARIVTHCKALDVSRDGARLRDELSGDELRRACAGRGGGDRSVDRWPRRRRATAAEQGRAPLLRAEALRHPASAFNILVPGSRNRFVFAVPRPDGTVQVGLTDDAVDEVEDTPSVSDAEERFLLETLSTGLSSPVTVEDVVGRFAGLRPLLGRADGASAADLSRRHALMERDGVLVIVGGKLTTYRRMAQDAVDLVAKKLGSARACVTTTLPLVGAGAPAAAYDDRLARRFGAESAEVQRCAPAEPIAPGLPVLRCEVGWAVAAEGALTADDVDRRLRLDLVPAWSKAARGYVEDVLAAAPSTK